MLAALLYICHQIASATRLSMKRMMNINTKSCCCAQLCGPNLMKPKPPESRRRKSLATVRRNPKIDFLCFSPLFLNILTQHCLRTNVHLSYIFLNPNFKSCMPVHLSCTQTQLHPSLVAATAQPTRGWTLARRLRLIMFAN